jgi:hypothetical protein
MMKPLRQPPVRALARILPVTLALLATGIATIPCHAEPREEPAKETAANAKDMKDGFDRLYQLRVDYFRRQVKIYEGIKDEKSAGAAAKEVRTLLPLQKSIDSLTKEFGPEGPEVYSEMQAKYGKELQEFSTKFLRLSYALADKPYFKAVESAELKNGVELGEPGAREALAIVEGGETPGPVEVVAKDPATKKAIEELLATAKSLNELLGGMKEVKGEERKTRIDAAMDLATQLGAQLKGSDPRPEAVEDLARNQETMRAGLAPLLLKVSELMQDPQLAEPLNEVLAKIMEAFAGA